MFLFPDAEQVSADFLRPRVHATSGNSDVEVLVKEPDVLPARFVKVRRAGGVRDLVYDNARLTYTAWGSDDPDAHDLAQLVRGLFLFEMRGAAYDGVFIYNVTEFGGPVPSVDPDTGRSRYFGTVEVRLRGTDG